MYIRTFFLFTLIIPIMSCVSFWPTYEYSDVFTEAKIILRQDDEYDFKEVNQTDQTLKTGINMDPEATSYASSSDGVLVISWFEQYYRVRNLLDGSLSEIIDFSEEIVNVAIAPDHSSYMVAGINYIQERDTQNHSPMRQSKIYDYMQSVEYSESGNLLIAYHNWGAVFWDVSSGRYIKKISTGSFNIWRESAYKYNESSNQLLVNFIPGSRDRVKGEDGNYYSVKQDQIYTTLIDMSTGLEQSHVVVQLPVENVYEISTVFSITGDRALSLARVSTKDYYSEVNYFLYCVSMQTGELLWTKGLGKIDGVWDIHRSRNTDNFYFITENLNLYEIDILDGTLIPNPIDFNLQFDDQYRYPELLGIGPDTKYLALTLRKDGLRQYSILYPNGESLQEVMNIEDVKDDVLVSYRYEYQRIHFNKPSGISLRLNNGGLWSLETGSLLSTDNESLYQYKLDPVDLDSSFRKLDNEFSSKLTQRGDSKYVAFIDTRKKDNKLIVWDLYEKRIVRELIARDITGSYISPNIKLISPTILRLTPGSRNHRFEPILLNIVSGRVVQSGDYYREIEEIARNTIELTFFPKPGIGSKEGTITYGGFLYNYTFDDVGMEVANSEGNMTIRLSHTESGEWFVVSNDGRFDCSDGGRDYVQFNVHGKSYSANQFWDHYYTPGLLAMFFGNEVLKSAVSPIEEVLAEAPSIEIISPKEGDTHYDELVVSVRVQDNGGGIGNMGLQVNGRIIDSTARGLLVVGSENKTDLYLRLMEGENTIRAWVYDREGRVQGYSEPLKINYRSQSQDAPDLFILSVGVSDYEDNSIDLLYPSNDAESIAGVFEEIGGRVYGNVSTTVLTDQEANLSRIREALTTIRNRTSPQDTVVLFFAGHGYTEEQVFYFLTHETEITNLPGTGLSIEEISRFIQELKAGKVAILFDTCQSGDAAKTLGQVAWSRGLDERKAIADLAKKNGIVVFAATSPGADAYEIASLNHGIFTYSLLTAIQERKDIVSRNSMISINRLMAEVEYLTRDTADRYLNMEQHPIKYNFGEDFDLGSY
jgi:Caspase domain